MTVKSTMLWFDECYAKVELENNDESITMTVIELDVDHEKSKPFDEFLKEGAKTEIYIGIEEAKELIKALEYVIAKAE